MTITKISAFEAEAETNHLLHDILPDRFTAFDARFDQVANVWRVPVVLAYPVIGPVGEVGEVLVSASYAQIVSYTPVDEMKTRARDLYQQHREAIEAAFLQTRDA
ncbi:MAG: hypothetical protein ACREEM_15385 [Blastocatellia bacterium]